MARQQKLLIVDDRAEICEVMSCYLAEQGHEVACATDSHSARRRLEVHPYDLVILDVLMPGEGGLQLAKFAKEQNTRVLLMSGNPAAMAKVLNEASDPFLSKPFHLAELDAAVRAVIEPLA